MINSILLTLVSAISTCGICIFLLRTTLPALCDNIRAYNCKEPFQPVDVTITDFSSEDGGGYYFRVKRVDGIITKELIPHYTSKDYCNNYEEAENQIGSHMTLYAQPCAPRLLYSKSAIDEELFKYSDLPMNLIVSLISLVLLFSALLWPILQLILFFIKQNH